MRHAIAAALIGALSAASTAQAEMLSPDSAVWQQLETMLGVPGDDRDAAMTGNSQAVQLMLPGRWVIQQWGVMREIAASGSLERGCEHMAVSIRPSPQDRFTFTATVEARGERFETHSIVWSGGSSFTHMTHMGPTLDRLGLDVDRMGIGPVFPIIRQAASRWTYLPLDDDTILTVSPEGGPPIVMARCLEAVAMVSEDGLVDACLAAARAHDFEGTAAQMASACGCIVGEVVAAELGDDVLAGLQTDFYAGSEALRASDRALYERINDTCQP
ncbi:MAG: hypothetical protein RLO50_12245 [Azospirillaceae bacterium]